MERERKKERKIDRKRERKKGRKIEREKERKSGRQTIIQLQNVRQYNRN